MRDSTKAALALALSTPLLTEIVSGNTPVHALTRPRVVVLLLLAYALPVVVIREVAVRRRLSTSGVFTLGVAYGILNEGSLAQTLMRFDHVPVDRFDGYFYAAGFNVAWASVIVPWHAMLAVILPIALVSCWVPSVAQTPWLGGRAFALASAVTVGLALFVSVVRPPRPQMLACLLAMAALVSVASRMRQRERPSPPPHPRRLGPFLFGGAAYMTFFLGSIVLAALRVPVPVFFVALAFVAVALCVVAGRFALFQLPTAGYVAWGAYFAPSVFTMAGGLLHHSFERTLTGGVCAATATIAAAWQGRHVGNSRSARWSRRCVPTRCTPWRLGDVIGTLALPCRQPSATSFASSCVRNAAHPSRSRPAGAPRPAASVVHTPRSVSATRASTRCCVQSASPSRIASVFLACGRSGMRRG
jgi:hypothetical protein